MQNKKIIIVVLLVILIAGIAVFVLRNKPLNEVVPEQTQRQNKEEEVSQDDFTKKVYALFDTSNLFLEGTIIENNLDTKILMVRQINDLEKTAEIHYDFSLTILFQQPTSTEQKIISPAKISDLKEGAIVLIYAKTPTESDIAEGIGIRILPRAPSGAIIAPNGQ